MVPATIQQMVASGEQSGNLSKMLRKIGETFEEKTETSTKNLSVLLEPILLLIVWGGVIMVALAVILPIYSMIGGFNDPAPGNMTTTTVVVSNDTNEEIIVPEERVSLPTLQVSDDVEWLNVRTKPFGEFLQRVSPGETFSYQGEKDDWYEIVLENQETGWVSGDYVTLLNYASAPKQEETSVTESEELWLEVLPTGTGYLNVRKNPFGELVGKVEPRSKYQYIVEKGGWYQIIFAGNQEGWVSGAYIKVISDE